MTLLKLWLGHGLGREAPFALFGLAIILAGWIADARSAFASTPVLALLWWYYFLEPRDTFALGGPGTLMQLAVLLAEGLGISLVLRQMERARNLVQVEMDRAKQLQELSAALAAATSVDDVARESGVAKGTVYIHFKTKAELLFHAIAEEKKKLISRFVPLLTEDLPPAERLKQYIQLSLLSVETAPLISRLMGGDREMLIFLDELGPDITAEMEAQQALGMTAMLEGVGDFDRLSKTERAERLVFRVSAEP